MPETPSPTTVPRPLVSCLTVTENRMDLLKRAIRCFAEQTWPEKELVVVSQGTEAYKREIVSHLETLGRADVRLLFVPPGHTLGALRNLSLDAMRGEVLALWDDDDVSHPERIAVQVEAMLREGARACFLGDRLHWFVDEGLAFWADHARFEGIRRLCLNTMVAFRDPEVRYPSVGPFASTGEDAAYVLQILERAPITVVSGRGDLFAYAVHGANTYARLNHAHLARTRARAVEEWPVPPTSALATLRAHGVGVRPAAPVDAEAIWEREVARASPAQVRRLLGVVALADGDTATAATHLDAEAAEGDARAWLDLGRIGLRAARLADAEAAFRRATALAAPFPEAWTGVGDALRGLERHGEAVEAYRRAIAQGAVDGSPFAGLGAALARLGRVAEAVEALREAVLRAPRQEASHVQWQAALRDTGGPGAPLDAYRRLAAERPYAARVHHHHGVLAAEARAFDEALGAWLRASTLEPRWSEPYLRAGEMALRNGRPAVAATRFRAAARAAPEDARAHALLGTALRLAGENAEAIEALTRGLERDPQLIPAWVDLALARRSTGDLAGARSAVDRVLALRPDHPIATRIRHELDEAARSASVRAPTEDPWSRFDRRWGLAPAPVGERPVFLLAAGWRSGSTLLQRLIAASGEVFVWGEPFGHAAIVPALAERTRAFDDQWPPTEWIAPDGAVAFGGEWVANLAPHPAALKASMRATLDHLYALPARGRAPRWGLKEVRFGADEARFLRWLYPDARFVFLVRNPWDAWSSYAGRKWLLRWPDPPVETPEAFAAHWARLVGDFLAWPFDDAIRVRHEDVVGGDPPLDAIARHLGMAGIDRSPLGAKVRGMERAPALLDAETVERIRGVVGPQAAQFAYSGPGSTRGRRDAGAGTE